LIDLDFDFDFDLEIRSRNSIHEIEIEIERPVSPAILMMAACSRVSPAGELLGSG
jgi:hypothetical protein